MALATFLAGSCLALLPQDFRLTTRKEITYNAISMSLNKCATNTTLPFVALLPSFATETSPYETCLPDQKASLVRCFARKASGLSTTSRQDGAETYEKDSY